MKYYILALILFTSTLGAQSIRHSGARRGVNKDITSLTAITSIAAPQASSLTISANGAGQDVIITANDAITLTAAISLVGAVDLNASLISTSTGAFTRITLDNNNTTGGLLIKDAGGTAYVVINTTGSSDTNFGSTNLGDVFFDSGSNNNAMTIKDTSGFVGINTTTPDVRLDVNGALNIRELSTDPSNPDEGSFTLWKSNGTGSGDDGDIMWKITSGAVTKSGTLIDFSTF